MSLICDSGFDWNASIGLNLGKRKNKIFLGHIDHFWVEQYFLTVVKIGSCL